MEQILRPLSLKNLGASRMAESVEFIVRLKNGRERGGLIEKQALRNPREHL